MNIDKNMEIKSEQKYLIISPRKLRPIVRIIKKLKPLKAIETLPFIGRRGSEVLLKVIKSAISNAKQKDIDVNSLEFKEIQIGEGPRLKRGQPVSRGRWHPIKKRMSHIRVILTTRNNQINTKLKSDNKNVETTKTTKKVKKGVKQKPVSAK